MNAMNNLDEKICEQLSAWMDGELSRDEAMFLERRLQHDTALQAMYSRLQMSSACMKGQSARLMPQSLCTNIKQALAEEVSPQKSRRPLFAWAAAASMAFAAIVFIPGMMQNTSAPEPRFAANAEQVTSPAATPSFASADLIASASTATATVSMPVQESPSTPTPVRSNPVVIETMAGVESPENFPLNVSSEKRSWPRSTVNTNSDPALEAYLVRHNQMMAQDGMGGFIPYVDVVAQDSEKVESASKGAIEKAGDNK